MRTPVLLVGWVHVSHSTGLPLPKMPRIYQLHMGHMAQYYGEIIFGKQLLGYSPNDTNILPLKVPESFFQTGNLWGCWKGSAQVKLRKYVLYTHNICVNISMHTHPCLKDTISKINIYIYICIAYIWKAFAPYKSCEVGIAMWDERGVLVLPKVHRLLPKDGVTSHADEVHAWQNTRMATVVWMEFRVRFWSWIEPSMKIACGRRIRCSWPWQSQPSKALNLQKVIWAFHVSKTLHLKDGMMLSIPCFQKMIQLKRRSYYR